MSPSPLDLSPSAPVRLPPSALALALLFGLLLWPRIDSGALWQHDELLTANRAREMIVRGDPWTVTLNFAPNFKKPPLQYWLCAGLLRCLPQREELAVRLPSLLYGAACLLAAAWLARVCFPEAGPALGAQAALALMGCGYFIHFSRVALLDTGAALHLTLAVAGCQLARRDARWHWFTGLQCALGAWQKAPYGFGAWAVILLLRGLTENQRQTDAPPAPQGFGSRHHLAGALTVSILAAGGWWLIQWLRHGNALLGVAAQQQASMFLRAHDPADQGFRPYLYWFWLARDWAVPGLCAPLAALAAVIPRRGGDGKRVFDPRLVEIGAICLVYGLALALLTYRAERYLVVITPLLAVLTVRWLGELTPRLAFLPTVARRWALPLVLASAAPVATFHYFSPTPAYRELQTAARELGHAAAPDEEQFISLDADPGFNVLDFVSFYSDATHPIRALHQPEIVTLFSGNQAPAHSCRGLCHEREWPALQRACPTLRLVTAPGKWRVWSYGSP